MTMLGLSLAQTQPHIGFMRWLSVTKMTRVLQIEYFEVNFCVLPSSGSDVP